MFEALGQGTVLNGVNEGRHIKDIDCGLWVTDADLFPVSLDFSS